MEGEKMYMQIETGTVQTLEEWREQTTDVLEYVEGSPSIEEQLARLVEVKLVDGEWVRV